MEQFGFKYSMINGYNAYRITVDLWLSKDWAEDVMCGCS
jgi:hypothetical protein